MNHRCRKHEQTRLVVGSVSDMMGSHIYFLSHLLLSDGLHASLSQTVSVPAQMTNPPGEKKNHFCQFAFAADSSGRTSREKHTVNDYYVNIMWIIYQITVNPVSISLLSKEIT